MNDLENAICSGLKDALNFYSAIADDWLFGAPESFLQHAVALSVYRRTGYGALTEMSPKKIAGRFLEKPKGRKPHSSRRRFDVVIWHKASVRLRCVMEIKRAFRFEPVKNDARKIESHLNLKTSTGAGYLLVYSEMDSARKREKGAQRRAALEEKFEDWANKLGRRGWIQVSKSTKSPQDNLYKNKKWSWGYCLYRLDKPTLA